MSLRENDDSERHSLRTKSPSRGSLQGLCQRDPLTGFQLRNSLGDYIAILLAAKSIHRLRRIVMSSLKDGRSSPGGRRNASLLLRE